MLLGHLRSFKELAGGANEAEDGLGLAGIKGKANAASFLFSFKLGGIFLNFLNQFSVYLPCRFFPRPLLSSSSNSLMVGRLLTNCFGKECVSL